MSWKKKNKEREGERESEKIGWGRKMPVYKNLKLNNETFHSNLPLVTETYSIYCYLIKILKPQIVTHK